jgi:alkaline phosphatase
VYAAHVDDRDKKDEIAQQFYNDKINGQHKVDVILGGVVVTIFLEFLS